MLYQNRFVWKSHVLLYVFFFFLALRNLFLHFRYFLLLLFFSFLFAESFLGCYETNSFFLVLLHQKTKTNAPTISNLFLGKRIFSRTASVTNARKGKNENYILTNSTAIDNNIHTTMSYSCHL